MTDRVKTEIHTHTFHSFDSKASFEEIEKKERSAGIDWIAVTDHDTIEGALRLRERGGLNVIVGEEISTLMGDVIGLFLEEEIPPHLPVEETIDAIRSQGGLVYIPHPFDRRRKTRLFREALERCVDRVDIIEVWNGRVAHPKDNEKAAEFARAGGIVGVAGSDAHSIREFGRAWMVMDPFPTAASFLESLRNAEAVIPQGPPPGPLHEWTTRIFRRSG